MFPSVLLRRFQKFAPQPIRAARFPAVKSFDTFDFGAIPSLNKPLTLELARCEYIVTRPRNHHCSGQQRT